MLVKSIRLAAQGSIRDECRSPLVPKGVRGEDAETIISAAPFMLIGAIKKSLNSGYFL